MPVAHLSITVSHLPASCSFYLSSLQPLGYRYIGQDEGTIGLGIHDADFFISQEKSSTDRGAVHIAFTADSRNAVDQFFQAAIKAGGRVDRSPRNVGPGCCYSASVIDLDGNIAECLYRVNASGCGPLRCSCGDGHIQDSTPGNTGDLIKVSGDKCQPEPANPKEDVGNTSTQDTSSTPGFFDSNKTLIGTILGVATGAAVAYALLKPDEPVQKEIQPAIRQIEDIPKIIYKDQACSAAGKTQVSSKKEDKPTRLAIEDAPLPDVKNFVPKAILPAPEKASKLKGKPEDKTSKTSDEKTSKSEDKKADKPEAEKPSVTEKKKTSKDRSKAEDKPEKSHKKRSKDSKKKQIEPVPTAGPSDKEKPKQALDNASRVSRITVIRKIEVPPESRKKAEELTKREPADEVKDNMSEHSRHTVIRAIEPPPPGHRSTSHVSSSHRRNVPLRSTTYPDPRSRHETIEPARGHSSSRHSRPGADVVRITPRSDVSLPSHPNRIPLPPSREGSRVTVRVESPGERILSPSGDRGKPPSAYMKYTTETYIFSPRHKEPEEYSLPPSGRSSYFPEHRSGHSRQPEAIALPPSEVSHRSRGSHYRPEMIALPPSEISQRARSSHRNLPDRTSFVSRVPSVSRSAASVGTVKPISRRRAERAMTDIDDTISLAPSDSISCASEKSRRTRRSSRRDY